MAKSIRKTLQAMEDLNNAFYIVPAQIADATVTHRRRTKEEEAIIPPRPVRRERRLTPPLPDDTSNANPKSKLKSKFSLLLKKKEAVKDVIKQITLDQPNCILLRLPAELRTQIWKEVICGGDKAPVNIEPNPLVEWEQPGRPGANQQRISPSRNGPKVQGLGVMGLLCSCRIVYSEVIPLLYSTPTFTFWLAEWGGGLMFLGFMGMMVPQRRAQVRWVDLRMEEVLQPPPKLDYTNLRKWEIRSELPDGRAGGESVRDMWAIEQVLKGMEGLEKGWEEIMPWHTP